MYQRAITQKERGTAAAGLIAVATILTVTFLFAALTGDSRQEPIMTYEDKTHELLLTFPLDWEERYLVSESETELSVFCRSVSESVPGSGLLFSIDRQTGELITEEDVLQQPTPGEILFKGNGYTYFLRMPSDVQYPAEEETLRAEYNAMSADVSKIIESIRLTGETRPAPQNEGFKVVGTSFFTTEIPQDWEIRASSDAPARWEIIEENKVTGSIEMIPFHSEGSDYANLYSDNMQRRYLTDNDSLREFRIELEPGSSNTVALNKIKGAFQFVGGPYNTVDVRSAAASYLEKGATKLFGQIKGYELKDGEPTIIKIRLMEYISGAEAASEPNGFKIKDTWRTRYYPLETGAAVLVLSPPNYNTYALYEMPTLDGTFAAEESNLNYYYDFILGTDGRIKMVLARYIP